MPLHGGHHRQGILTCWEGRQLRFHGWNFIPWPDAASFYEAPWCAVDPTSGLLYSSPFATDAVHAFRVHVPRRVADRREPSLDIRHVGAYPLSRPGGEPASLGTGAGDVSGVQGGAISRNRHLYLVVHHTDDEHIVDHDGAFHEHDQRRGDVRWPAGIYGFDMLEWRQRFHLPVHYHRGASGARH